MARMQLELGGEEQVAFAWAPSLDKQPHVGRAPALTLFQPGRVDAFFDFLPCFELRTDESLGNVKVCERFAGDASQKKVLLKVSLQDVVPRGGGLRLLRAARFVKRDYRRLRIRLRWYDFFSFPSYVS